jgi:protein-S-isoprenylcysteine O-methyltransferase Ste14
MGFSPWLIMLSVIIYGVIHSLLASFGAKTRARRAFGKGVDRWYRLAYNIFATVSLLPVLVLPVILPDRNLYIIPYPWNLLFLAGQGLAILALIVGLWHTGIWSFMGLQQLIEPVPSEPQQFSTRGLYRWVRHPLYTAGLVFIWLVPVMTVNLLVLNIGLTSYLVVGAIYEERKLLREFGEAYVDYQKLTPMLIPRLSGRR